METPESKRGCILIILHSHLPFLREPEVKDSIEETWFFEAIIESYIPLIMVFERLIERGVLFKLVLSLSPTLLEMLEDQYLMDRLKKHIDRLNSLIERELKRTKRSLFYESVEFYRKRLTKIKNFLEGRSIINALEDMAGAGYLQLITTAATHAYLPLFSQYPQVVQLQVNAGLEIFKRHIKLHGGNLQGFWLPECGYYDGLIPILKKACIDWTVLEGHGIVFGNPVPPCGIFSPVINDGLFLFGRDAETCRFVWSKEEGYPGNPWYRDFYSDICYELNDNEWRLFRKDGIRHHTGLKYYRVTGRSKKKPYIRERALKIAHIHALDFIEKLRLRTKKASALTKKPVITLAFDTELFGHWWFEGPEWLEKVIELISAERNLRLILPEDILNTKRKFAEVSPLPSSWGEGGVNSTWLSKENSAYVRGIYRAIESAPPELFERYSPQSFVTPSPLRELLLMQSSDFLFMLKKGEMARLYGEKRLKEHLMAFGGLLP